MPSSLLFLGSQMNLPSSLVYLGIMLIVIVTWFVAFKRPVYEAVLLSFLTALSNLESGQSEEGRRTLEESIRRAAVENGVTTFTSLDTVGTLLDVLEETTFTVSTIDT